MVMAVRLQFLRQDHAIPIIYANKLFIFVQPILNIECILSGLTLKF